MRHKRYHRLSFAFGLASLLILAGGGCGSTPTATTPPTEPIQTSVNTVISGFSLYENKDFNFSIQYPQNWDMTEPGGDIKVQFYSPQENEDDTFKENVNVIVSSLPAKVTFDQYVDANLKQLQGGLKDFKMESSKEENLPVGKAKSLTFTGIFDEEVGTLKWRQTYALSGNKLFVISYTGAVNNFDKYLPEAIKMNTTLNNVSK